MSNYPTVLDAIYLVCYNLLKLQNIFCDLQPPMNQSRLALRLNVGFLIGSSVGTSRDFFFDLPQTFIEPDLYLNSLSGIARITRTAQGLLAQVKMNASLHTECSRCLTELEQSLDINFTELFAFSSRSVSESGLILPEDGQLNLAPLVREYTLLEIPINPICRPDCQGLCPECGEVLTDGHHHHEENSIDPRLALLKELLDNNLQD